MVTHVTYSRAASYVIEVLSTLQPYVISVMVGRLGHVRERTEMCKKCWSETRKLRVKFEDLGVGGRGWY
jgi:hypothetical protein